MDTKARISGDSQKRAPQMLMSHFWLFINPLRLGKSKRRMLLTRSVSKTSSKGYRRSTYRISTQAVAKKVTWGLQTRTTNNLKSFISALVVNRLSVLCLMSVKTQETPHGSKVPYCKHPKRLTKRQKTSFSKANSTAFMLTRESGL